MPFIGPISPKRSHLPPRDKEYLIRPVLAHYGLDGRDPLIKGPVCWILLRGHACRRWNGVKVKDGGWPLTEWAEKVNGKR